MKKLIFITAILTMMSSLLYAQNVRFVYSGIITYQKTVNMYAVIQRSINKENETFLKPAFELYKQQHPQFKELESRLIFNTNQTIFSPVEKTTTATSFFKDPQISMQNNIVYSDLYNKQIISKRKVFDKIYLLKDSIKNIKWKFTDEVRDVAGYSCRRANGIVLDSIYIVAFYTDRIPVSGGPELFTGLPGMILQLALPHENVSWIATKVEDIGLPANSILPPAGGHVLNFRELLNKLKNAYKDNPKNASKDFKAFLL